MQRPSASLADGKEGGLHVIDLIQMIKLAPPPVIRLSEPIVSVTLLAVDRT